MIVYQEIDGCWTLSDTHVKEFYQKMDIKNLFYYKTPTEAEFIQFCKNPKNIVLFFSDGVGIFTDVGISAECHINSWGHSMTNAFMALNYIYNKGIRTVVGVIPGWYKKAIRFIEKVGFTKVGVIPDYSDTYKGVSDFTLYYRCRDWNER